MHHHQPNLATVVPFSSGQLASATRSDRTAASGQSMAAGSMPEIYGCGEKGNFEEPACWRCYGEAAAGLVSPEKIGVRGDTGVATGTAGGGQYRRRGEGRLAAAPKCAASSPTMATRAACSPASSLAVAKLPYAPHRRRPTPLGASSSAAKLLPCVPRSRRRGEARPDFVVGWPPDMTWATTPPS